MNYFLQKSCDCYMNSISKDYHKQEVDVVLPYAIRRIKIDKNIANNRNLQKFNVIGMKRQQCSQFRLNFQAQNLQKQRKNKYVKLKLLNEQVLSFQKPRNQLNINGPIPLNSVQNNKYKYKKKMDVICSRSKQRTQRKKQIFEELSWGQNSSSFNKDNQKYSKEKLTQFSITYVNRSPQNLINRSNYYEEREKDKLQFKGSSSEYIMESVQIESKKKKKYFLQDILHQQNQLFEKVCLNPISGKNKNRLLKANRLKDQIIILQKQQHMLNRQQEQLLGQLQNQRKQFQARHWDLINKKHVMEMKETSIKSQLKKLFNLINKIKKRQINFR